MGVSTRARLVRTAHNENVHQRGHRHTEFPVQAAGALPVHGGSHTMSPTQDSSLLADPQRSHVQASSESHWLPFTETTAVPPAHRHVDRVQRPRHSPMDVIPWHSHTLNLSNSEPSGPGYHGPRHVLEVAPVRHNVMSSSIRKRREAVSGGHFAVIGSSGLPRFSNEAGEIDEIMAIEQVQTTVPGAVTTMTTPLAAVVTTAAAMTTPGVATTGAPAATIPAAPVAAAPPSGGGIGDVLLIVILIGLVVGAVYALYRHKTEKIKNSSRLANAQHGDDSQFWKSAKARQSYRKSAISGHKEDSESTDDATKSAGQEAGSLASASSEPVQKGSSYRSRRMQQNKSDGSEGSRRQLAKARSAQTAAQEGAANAGGGTGAAEDVSV